MAITKEYEVKINGSKSVRELKQEILDARDALKEMQGGTEEYNNAVKGLTEKELELIQIMKAQKGEGTALEGSYRAISEEMSALKKVYKELGDEATRNAMGERINDLNNQLKAMDYSQGVYSRNVGNYMSALKVLNGEYKNQREELKACKVALESMDPTMEGYNELFQRAAEITHNMADQTESLKYASPDLGDQLSNINGIAGNLAAGYSAVNAAMTLFGEENEDIQKIMVKVQASMQLVQGLQGLDGLLKRTEGLSRALGLVKKSTNQATAATTAQATATNAQTAATEGATVAQKGLNTAMKANPIGAVIVVITALVGYFVLLKDEIMRVIGGADKMNATFEKVKIVATGVGNVIKKMLVAPMTALIRVIQGDFRGAVNEIINAFDVVGNYQDGAAKKTEELAKEAVKKKQEQYIKDKENYIKNEEAKSGSDWKYSEEGKKAYEDLYKKKMELYDKDSDEFLNAQREMWAYQREYDEKRNKTIKTTSKNTTDAIKKELEEAAKALEEYMKNTSIKTIENIAKMVEDWNKVHTDNPIYFSYKFDDWSKDELEKKLLEEVEKINFDDILKKMNLEDLSIKASVNKINLKYDWDNLLKGVEFPKDVIDNIQKTFDPQITIVEKHIERVKKVLDNVAEEFGKNSDIYRDIETEYNNLWNTLFSLQTEKAQKVSDVQKKIYEDEFEAHKKFEEQSIKLVEEDYLIEEAHYNGLWNIMRNDISLNKEKWLAEKVVINDKISILQNEMRIREEMANDELLINDERVAARARVAEIMTEISHLQTQEEINDLLQKQEAWRTYYDTVQNSMNGVVSILDNVGKAMEQNIQNDIKNNNISEEEGERRFEDVKKVQYASAMINAFSSAASAYQSLASIPYVGPALGAAAAAAALASGIAQANSIKNTTLNGGSSSGSSRYAEATPTPTDFNPQYTSNVSGYQETQDLANALTKSPIKTFVVESELTAKQEVAKQRNDNTTF